MSIPALVAVTAGLLLALSGCSETACQEASKNHKATHACYLENKKEENEVKKEEYGSLGAAKEAEHDEEVEEEVEEVEEIIKREKAEETAQALRELER